MTSLIYNSCNSPVFLFILDQGNDLKLNTFRRNVCIQVKDSGRQKYYQEEKGRILSHNCNTIN